MTGRFFRPVNATGNAAIKGDFDTAALHKMKKNAARYRINSLASRKVKDKVTNLIFIIGCRFASARVNRRPRNAR